MDTSYLPNSHKDLTTEQLNKITVTKIQEHTPKITVKKVTTQEQNKQYYIKFLTTHENIIRKKFECELCGGKYTYYNKSKHHNSKKHQKKLLEKPKENE